MLWTAGNLDWTPKKSYRRIYGQDTQASEESYSSILLPYHGDRIHHPRDWRKQRLVNQRIVPALRKLLGIDRHNVNRQLFSGLSQLSSPVSIVPDLFSNIYKVNKINFLRLISKWIIDSKYRSCLLIYEGKNNQPSSIKIISARAPFIIISDDVYGPAGHIGIPGSWPPCSQPVHQPQRWKEQFE